MRIAFFGLAYHQRTGSSRFILDLLARHGTVESIFAEADPADLRRQAAGFDETRYDAILVWQLHEAFALLSGRHPNVTFAPMYDAMLRGGAFRWRQRFGTAKILCFSWALRREVMRRAAHLHQVQYYPEPGPRSPAGDDPALRGFLWYRHRAVTPQRVFALTAGTSLASLAIHDAPDPGHAIPADWDPPAHVGRIAGSRWAADRAGFDAGLRAANLFFASRPLEGIGMAFLEAMAAGLCVVAPDAPTMNEYISHGRNGLLYAPDRAAPLDLSHARALGAAARESVLRGRARWEAGVPALEAFLLTPIPALGRPVAAAAWPTSAPADWILPELPIDLAAQPPEIGVVIGHHCRVAPDGAETLIRPAAPEAAWARLLAGEVGAEGPLGMPAPAATAVRRSVLARLGAAPPRTDAALLDLLLRAREAGIGIAEAEQIAARCPAAPLDMPGWQALIRSRAGDAAASRFAAAIVAARQREASRQATARPARLALGLVSLLDRLSPRLADAVEGVLLGGMARRVRALLRGRPAA